MKILLFSIAFIAVLIMSYLILTIDTTKIDDKMRTPCFNQSAELCKGE